MSGAAFPEPRLAPPRNRMTESRLSMQPPDATSPRSTRPAPPAVQTPPVTPSTAAPSAGEADSLARAQAGDHHAFAHLYSLHKRRIYSLCLRMVGNVAEAEDLTQEAFLQ